MNMIRHVKVVWGSLQNIGQDMGDPKRVPTGTGPVSPMTFEVFRLGLS